MKRKLLLSGIAVLICTLGVYLLTYFSLPNNEINKLAEGYVKVEVLENKTQFTVISEKPKNWIQFNEIPKSVWEPIVIKEDWAFFEHSGVDYNQLLLAIKDSLTDGKKLRGASTISQQVAKNVFLTQERSYWRKIKEYFITKKMESVLGKEKILEIYLNILHLGKDVYGVKSASRYYFQKDLSQLNYREGSFLAMLTPNPEKYSESFRKRKHTKFASQEINETLDKLVRANKISIDNVKSLKQTTFSWQKNMIKQINAKPIKRDISKASRKYIDGSEIENSMKVDSDTVLNDELTYDDDALIEDQSGFEQEFSVE